MLPVSLSRQTILPFLAHLFVNRADAYLGEVVTMTEHMLQTAALAEREGAHDSLVAAALLHDIGHFNDAFGAYSPDDQVDRRHDQTGADLLAPFFPPAVFECVRLHVAAKRYLCGSESNYYTGLTAASKHSLRLQGGPMNERECQAFASTPYALDAVRLRRWDDGGKVAGAATKRFADYQPMLQRLIDRVQNPAKQKHSVLQPELL